MNWVDVAILIIISLSAIISLFRGFVREAVSLASWILAFWVSISFSDKLVPMLEGLISSQTIRLTAAFAVLFLVTLLVGALINYIIGQLVQKTGMGGTDRVLGILFGIGRGLLLVAILVMLGGIPQLSHETWWQESMFIVHFQDMAIWMRDFLPPNMAKNFVF